MHSIDQGPEKSESEGDFYMILMRSWSRAGELKMADFVSLHVILTSMGYGDFGHFEFE